MTQSQAANDRATITEIVSKLSEHLWKRQIQRTNPLETIFPEEEQ